jgi:hypothetical protein
MWVAAHRTNISRWRTYARKTTTSSAGRYAPANTP